METKIIPINEHMHFLSSMKQVEHFNRKKKGLQQKNKCNICGKSFMQRNRFERFCITCKEESELYHYSEGF